MLALYRRLAGAVEVRSDDAQLPSANDLVGQPTAVGEPEIDAVGLFSQAE